MLLRSLRIPPSLLLFLLFCGFLGWHFSGSPLPGPAPQPPSAGNKQKKTSEAVPGKPRVALATFITDQQSYMHVSLKSKDHYVRRHGYDLIVDYEAHSSIGGPVWWKFDMVRRLIKEGKYDWIWWLDFDTLITNTSIEVTDIINETLKNTTDPDEVDYLFSRDCNDLNLGSFVVRAHERSLKFLDGVIGIEHEGKKKNPDAQLSEQDAITEFMKKHPDIKKKSTTVIPQWKINAFPDEIGCYEVDDEQPWKHGFFVIHFAGAWAHVQGDDPTGQLMKKYQDEIIWGDWKDFY